MDSAGFEWENGFIELCKLHGLSATKMGFHSEYDVLVNGHRVQCKHTDFCDKSRIRISRGSSCSASRNYAPGDFDFYAIRYKGDCFIVPAFRVGISNGKLKRRFPVRRLFQYKDRFDLLTTNGACKIDTQLNLIFE